MSTTEYIELNISFIEKIADMTSDYGLYNEGYTEEEHDAVAYFIGKCSLSDFEALKEMDYDLTNNEPDDTEE